MKKYFFIFILLIHFTQIKSLSYVGTWGVYDGCNSRCCCPAKGALVKITQSASNELRLVVEKGGWSGCEAYGWKSGTPVLLPFDDKTHINLIDGVETSYNNINGESITWTWYPVIGEADDSADGVKKGDPIALITVKQGDITGCEFIISGEILKVGLILLMLIAFVMM